MTKSDEGTKESSRRRCWWSKYWFYAVLISLAVVGVPSAFFIPPIIPGLTNDGNTVVSVRQGILAVLAGALTMLTLSETHRKNTHEKDKNDRDHTRQVYAERRSRYTKAVEQLANEKAAVRLGGIYTLVGLVDEWLADESLAKDKQKEEGQVIINNLCSYIRSPFPLAEKIEEYEARKELEKLKKIESEKLTEKESSQLQILLKRFKDSDEYEKPKNITANYAKFHEEQDVRRTIFVEMSKRSSDIFKEAGKVIKTVPGAWSDFEFDFSRAPIFYPLHNLTIEKPNFSSSRFYGDMSFRSTAFTQNADFSRAIFIQDADFRRVIFIQKANFEGATFIQNANFRLVTFAQNADFRSVTFTQNADFRLVTFTQNADFRRAAITQRADFIRTAFIQNADFSGAVFTQNANFGGATFTQNVNFGGGTFKQKGNFVGAIFNQKAHFTGTIFTENVNFSEVIFKTYMPFFTHEKEPRAEFSVHADPQKHNFKTHLGSQPIPLGKTKLGGVERFIPVGAVLFDPTSWDEESQAYIDTSDPAKPLDKSNGGEEDKPE